NSFSVVRTRRVLSHAQTARTAIAAASTCSATAAIVAGQPTTISPIPTAASASARANGAASTTPCRRSSRQIRSMSYSTMAFAAFAKRRKIPGHERNGERRRARDGDRDRDRRRRARPVGAPARDRARVPPVHPRRSDATGDRGAQTARSPPGALGLALHYVVLFALVGLILWIVVQRAVDQVQNAVGSPEEIH